MSRLCMALFIIFCVTITQVNAQDDPSGKNKKEKKEKEPKENKGNDKGEKNLKPAKEEKEDKKPDVADDKTCDRFRNGSMKYSTEPYLGIQITRKGRKHVEYNPTTGQKSIFKIYWKNACNYMLRFKKSNMPHRMRKGWETEFEVWAIYEEYYEWEATIHGIKYWGTVTKTLSKSEKRAKEKLAEAEAAKARRDSVQHVKDSIWAAENPELAKKRAEEKAAAEAKLAAKKGETPPGDPKASGEKPKAEDPAAKGKKEDGKSGEKTEGKEKKAKGEKPPMEEKKEKEKSEKPPKEKKEKEPAGTDGEKPAKEKKEKKSEEE